MQDYCSILDFGLICLVYIFFMNAFTSYQYLLINLATYNMIDHQKLNSYGSVIAHVQTFVCLQSDMALPNDVVIFPKGRHRTK